MSSPRMIEHQGIVHQCTNGMALIALDTGGCSSCGQGAACGIGRMASGRAATLLSLAVDRQLHPGERVTIGLPASRLGWSAALGYFFPALALLLGAVLGGLMAGSDAAAALGAMGGFLLALIISRIIVTRWPACLPVPRLISAVQPAPDLTPLSPLFSHQEFHHER